MFNIFRRNNNGVLIIADEQHKLDSLRYENANNPLMQLHCDRMQAALDAR